MAIPTTQKIAAAYVAFFNRAPDQDGLTFWQAQVPSVGATEAQDLALMRSLASGFANHPTFADTYGNLGNAAFVDAIYVNVGGAPADANGRAFWVAKLNGDGEPAISRAQFVADFVYGLLTLDPAVLDQQVADGIITAGERDNAILRQDRMLNITEVATRFTQTLGAGSNLALGTDPLDPASLANDPAYIASQQIIAGVTADPASKVAPLAYLNGTPTIQGIINDAPVAIAGSASGNEDNAITGVLQATDADTGNAFDPADVLTYSITSGTTNGTVVVNPATGVYTYTPNANFNGTDSFSFTVTDSAGATSTATVNLTVAAVNDAPVPQNSAVSGDEGSAITGVVAATDVEGDALVYALATGGAPANGTVSVGGDGSFTYTPNAGFNGPDSFTFQVSDGNGGVSTGTVSITVRDIPNIFTAGTDLFIGRNVNNETYVAANDTLNTGDVVTGGGGTDTVIHTVDATVRPMVLGTLTYSGFVFNDVDTFQVTNDSGRTVAYDLSSSGNNFTLTNLNSTSDVEFNFARAGTGGVTNMAINNLTASVGVLLDIIDSDDTGNDRVNVAITGPGAVGVVEIDAAVETVAVSTASNAAPVVVNALVTGGPNLIVDTGATGGSFTVTNALEAGVISVTATGTAGVNLTAGSLGGTSFLTGDASDTLTGGIGSDTFNAGGGNNVINTGEGDNLVNTGAGNDVITAGGGNDTINGGDGNNSIITGNGINVVTTGIGNDTIATGNGQDFVQSGGGNDLVGLGGGNDSIETQDGNDIIAVANSNLDGNDTINGGGQTTLDVLQVVGVGGGDTLNDADLANVRDIEALQLLNTDANLSTQASLAGIRVLDVLSNSNDLLDLTGFTNNVAVTTGAGRDTFTFNVDDAGTKSVDFEDLDVTAGVGDVADFDVVNVVDGGPFPGAGSINMEFTSAEVGNGNRFDGNNPGADMNGGLVQDGGLAVRLYTDANPSQVHRFDDEGVVFVANNNNAINVSDLTNGADRGNFQTVVLGTAGADTITTAGRLGNVYINAGDGSDTLIADGASGDVRHFLVGAGGSDLLIVSNTDLNDTVVALTGGGSNTVNANGTDARVNINSTVPAGATAGTNTYNFGANLGSEDTVTGGAGSDTIRVNASVADGQFLNVTGVERLDLFNSFTVDATLGAEASQAGITLVTDSAIASSDNGITIDTGFANELEVRLTASDDGVDRVTNLAGVALTVEMAYVGMEDTLSGGNGTDTLNLFANLPPDSDNDFINVTGFEQVTVSDRGDGIGSGGDVIITNFNTNTVANGAVMVVDASALDESNETLTLDASGNMGTGAVSVLGGAGADTVIGTMGNDFVSSAGGNDVLTGGDGQDTLIGGLGNDTYIMSVDQFNFDLDTITEDVGGGTDTLRLTSTMNAVIPDVGFNGRFANLETVEFSSPGAPSTFTATLGGFSSATGLRTFTALDNAVLNLTITSQFVGGDVTVNGGNGNDVVQGGLTAVAITFNDAGASGNDSVTTGAGNDTINLGNGDNVVVTNGGNDLIVLNGPDLDMVDAGMGNDTVTAVPNGAVTDADVLTAGTGTDVLNLQGSTTLTVANLVTGFETINLGTGIGGYTTYNLAVNDGSAPDASGTLTVNGSGLRAPETLTFDGSGVTAYTLNVSGGHGFDALTGGALADSLSGGGGSDTILGGAGNDTLVGGERADVINGGAGTDRIDLTESLQGKDTVVLNLADIAGNVDNIFGFNAAGGDRLAYDSGVVTGVGSNVAGAVTAVQQMVQGDAVSGANVINVLDTVAGANSRVAVATYLQTSNFGGTPAGEAKLFYFNDGVDTYVWRYLSDGNANVNATEFTNVEILRGVTGVTTANVINDTDVAVPNVIAGAGAGTAGVDIFDFTGLGFNDGPSDFNTIAMITGFQSGTDYLQFRIDSSPSVAPQLPGQTSNFEPGVTPGGYVENLTPAASLAAMGAAAAAAHGAGAEYYFGVFGGDGYLITDDVADGWGTVIQLVGVTDMAASDIIVA